MRRSPEVRQRCSNRSRLRRGSEFTARSRLRPRLICRKRVEPSPVPPHLVPVVNPRSGRCRCEVLLTCSWPRPASSSSTSSTTRSRYAPPCLSFELFFSPYIRPIFFPFLLQLLLQFALLLCGLLLLLLLMCSSSSCFFLSQNLL